MRATASSPDVPLSSRCTMPGPVRAHRPRRRPGRPARGSGPAAPRPGSRVVPGAGVDDETGRLVHHGHQLVGVDDLEAHARLGAPRPSRRLAGIRTVEVRPRAAAVPPGGDGLAVDEDPAGLDQLRRLGPGDVGHHGDAPVHPQPGQQRRHLRRDRSPRLSAPAQGLSLAPRHGALSSRSAERRRRAARRPRRPRPPSRTHRPR